MPLIIIVDDDVNNYHLLNKALEQIKGCITFHAHSSSSFFKLIKRAVPDFIFLKIVMPGPDAMYCLKKLRANRKYNNVPVIAFYYNEDYKIAAYKNKANLYFTIPEYIHKVTLLMDLILSYDWKLNFYPPTGTISG